jgi:hypothetical protein
VKNALTSDELMIEDLKHLEETRNKIVYSTEMPDALQLKNSAESISVILKKLTEQA